MLTQEESAEENHNDPDGHVDEEHPAPRQMIGEQSTKDPADAGATMVGMMMIRAMRARSSGGYAR
jgi:hypothetical protein